MFEHKSIRPNAEHKSGSNGDVVRADLYTLDGEPVISRHDHLTKRHEALQAIADHRGRLHRSRDAGERKSIESCIARAERDVAKCERFLATTGSVPTRPTVKAKPRPATTSTAAPSKATTSNAPARIVDPQVVNGWLAQLDMMEHADVLKRDDEPKRRGKS